ncbi:TatA/E family twin arginine-targeting protein translocase [Roseofilum reptotaenium CS-1145]|uniref:Sec-independent protein translocase protein TatA n=1 Tax=Roseofilum reptotaenium AO1-A TaxID=1925591 RepID=A0A1L9QQQ2_9CYAN|nr:TatA/E family twin arginine-targeting protein translocase [Roseofilum reptotaenium]MDB9516250.1 TatA/E family twin arginine-targeting protein translocase [Roseofilum reptotaenium CS-1145]OJJ24973.1 Sec-independent protein translocase TatA [Roseofilum reptotaenium AO1-A]
MNIFGIGLPEMAVIMIVALLIFGPKKLPEMGKAIAKTIRSFQQASKEFEQEFKREAAQIEASVKEQPSIQPSVEVIKTPESEPQETSTASNNSTSTS